MPLCTLLHLPATSLHWTGWEGGNQACSGRPGFGTTEGSAGGSGDWDREGGRARDNSWPPLPACVGMKATSWLILPGPVLAPTWAAAHTSGPTCQGLERLTLHSPQSPILSHAAADSDLQPYVRTGHPRKHCIKHVHALGRLPPQRPPGPLPHCNKGPAAQCWSSESTRGVGRSSWALHEGWRSGGRQALLAQGRRTHLCLGPGTHATGIRRLDFIRRNQFLPTHPRQGQGSD